MSWYDPIVQVLGSFDPLKFDRVRKLILAFECEPTSRLDIDVLAAYSSRHFILFRMCNAKQVRIGEIDSSLMQLGELFIDSLEGRGLEGLNYQVHDELGALSCYCQELAVIQIIETDDTGNDKVIWSSGNCTF
jgi:hypothetical protein